MSLFRRAGAQIARLLKSTSDPAAEADRVMLYAKDVAGVTQLLARASDGTISQISPNPPAIVAVDPTAGGGVVGVLNSLLVRTDIPSIYYKSGAGNTAWTVASVAPLATVAVDPTAGGGVPGILNELLVRTDIPSIYYKSGAGNTAWTVASVAPLTTIASDPTAGAGKPGILNEFLVRTDVSSLYYKSGAADTAWTLVATTGIVNGSGQQIVVTGGNDLFGTGQDGDLTLDGTTTVIGMVPVASGTNNDFGGLGRAGNFYTATRNIYANNLTINTTVSLNMKGWQLYVKGTLTLTGTAQIADNGFGGLVAGATNAGTLRPAGWYGDTRNGGAGDGAGAGGNASVGATNTIGSPYITSTIAASIHGAVGGSCQGGGGGSSTGVGGGGGSVVPRAVADSGPYTSSGTWFSNGLIKGSGSLAYWGFGTGGGGGASGPGNPQGGGGGAPGGCIYINARVIAGSGTIEAKGGSGSQGGTSGIQKSAGGGGGGGGGLAVITYVTRTGTVTINTSGGAGGAPGANTGGGQGEAGGNGGAGFQLLFNLSGDGT